MQGSPGGAHCVFGHGADVFSHSPSAMIQSRRERQRNHRFLQNKTREREKNANRMLRTFMH